MRRRLIAVTLVSLLAAPQARADGCKFATDGRMVPEREQRAFVTWADGVETLHVAALSDATSEGSVWVVPIRAAAGAVRGEPVELFPTVVYYETLRGRAVRQLRASVAFAAVLDSGGLLCPFFIGGCGGAGVKSDVVEESRVEKYGMVVTVVSAESRGAIEAYLDAQGVNRAAADLSSLDPYFREAGYSFVCGWVAKGQTVTATGIQVVFPSPTLWFPLRPTRAYTNPVETVVYARGFVKPARGCDLPGLTCEYIYGDVKSRLLSRTFAADKPQDPIGYYPHGKLERLTRVTLTTDPQKWDRDLELVPGTTATGTVAVAVTGWAGFLGPLWSALLGAVLGLALTRWVVPKTERRRVDYLAGAVTGAAIVFTVWASAVVFALWRRFRFRGHPSPPRGWVVLPVLAVAHFGVVLAVCEGLVAWIGTGTPVAR